jgi:hypothetical protein
MTSEFRFFCMGGWAALMVFAVSVGVAALAAELMYPDAVPGLLTAGVFASAAPKKETVHP